MKVGLGTRKHVKQLSLLFQLHVTCIQGPTYNSSSLTFFFTCIFQMFIYIYSKLDSCVCMTLSMKCPKNVVTGDCILANCEIFTVVQGKHLSRMD